MKEIQRNNQLIEYFIFMLFYLFFVLPVVSNLVYPEYDYNVFYQANDAMRNCISKFVYLMFVNLFSYVIMSSAKKTSPVDKNAFIVKPQMVNLCTAIIVVCFVITLSISGFSALLNGFGYAYLNPDIHVNEAVVGCGIISYLMVLGHAKIVSKYRLFFLTLIVFCFFWIVGKRYIIAETLVMSVCVLGMTGNISGRKMIKSLVVCSVLIVGLGFLYGISFKGNAISFLDYLNVDFSRQYTLVYQFYCENIGRQISPHQFDAVLYLLTFFIPRSVWPNKPYPFSNYLTLSLTGQDVDFVNVGWSTTCSVFSDLFDSFSYFGLLLGIFLFVKLFHKINLENRIHYKVLWTYLCVRLLTVQISSAIIQITVMLIVLSIAERLTSKRIFDGGDVSNINRGWG